MMPPPPPALRPVSLPPLTAQPTTDELLNQMTVVLYYADNGGKYQARRRGCKDYGEAASTARQAMLNALKVPL